MRNRIDLTQAQLAEASGISIRALQRIESGERTPRGNTVKELAKALKCSISDLYKDPNEKPQSPLEQAMLVTQAQLKALSEESNKKGVQAALDAINKPTVPVYDDSPKGMLHKLIEGLSDNESKQVRQRIQGYIDEIRTQSQGRYIRPQNLRKDKK